jgi:hypothetical protein
MTDQGHKWHKWHNFTTNHTAEQRERARQRAARQKHLRRILNERGFYAVLRQLADGGDNMGRDAQLRILKMVESAVQEELWKLRSRESEAKRQAEHKYRNSRRGKIEALLADPSITDGERAAAQAAIKRLRR